MKTSDLDYDLPQERIARYPAGRREDSRLMRLERSTGRVTDHRFSDLPQLFRPGDLLVLNDTRVIPARLLGRRAPDGGKIEVLLVRQQPSSLILHPCESLWWALVRPGKKIKTGNRLVFVPGRFEATVEAYGEQGSGERLLRFQWEGKWWEVLEEAGHTPLPPYILRARKHDAETQSRVGPAPPPTHDASPAAPLAETPEDRARYQTIYAGEERASVAAPTAGLHFSQPVFDALDRRGVERVFLQLHVGPGTFQPIKSERVEDHCMHEEFIRVAPGAAERIHAARAEGRRVVAVGTTVVRALETAALAAVRGSPQALAGDLFRADTAGERGFVSQTVQPISGWTRLMITPGFEFRAVDALLTNFHLPRSTLLLLVSAFASRDMILGAYRQAIERRYRFYSYGDCMLIE